MGKTMIRIKIKEKINLPVMIYIFHKKMTLI